MKKHLILIIVLCFAATLQLKAQKEYTVSSPNGTLELKIITEDTLSYQLFSGGEAISEISPIAMVVERNGRPTGFRRKSGSGKVYPEFYQSENPDASGRK